MWHNVSGDVKEVSPGHWTGPWKSVGVRIDDVGHKGEDAMSLVETGTIDMVWKSPTELSSCTDKSTPVFTHKDGCVMVFEKNETCKPAPVESSSSRAAVSWSVRPARAREPRPRIPSPPTNSLQGLATSVTWCTRPHTPCPRSERTRPLGNKEADRYQAAFGFRRGGRRGFSGTPRRSCCRCTSHSSETGEDGATGEGAGAGGTGDATCPGQSVAAFDSSPGTGRRLLPLLRFVGQLAKQSDAGASPSRWVGHRPAP